MAKKRSKKDTEQSEKIEVIASPSDELEKALREELEHINQQLTESQESYLRSVAENQNLRKRHATELEKARKFSVDRFAKSMLEVLESLDKACEMEQSDDVSAVLEGVELTRKQLLSIFEKESVQKIAAEPGDEFDANYHEAMAMVPTDSVPPNCIVEVFRPGYMLHDRLLRAAMVIVSTQLPQSEKTEDKLPEDG